MILILTGIAVAALLVLCVQWTLEPLRDYAAIAKAREQDAHALVAENRSNIESAEIP